MYKAMQSWAGHSGLLQKEPMGLPRLQAPFFPFHGQNSRQGTWRKLCWRLDLPFPIPPLLSPPPLTWETFTWPLDMLSFPFLSNPALIRCLRRAKGRALWRSLEVLQRACGCQAREAQARGDRGSAWRARRPVASGVQALQQAVPGRGEPRRPSRLSR